jgi:hypothetical protein
MALMLGVQDQDSIIIHHNGEILNLKYVKKDNNWRILFNGPKSFVIERGDNELSKQARKEKKSGNKI